MVLKIVKHVSRIFIGIVFAFSGYVKAVDPLGFAYKLDDYLDAFGMPWLEPITLPLGVLACVLEFGIGILFLANVFIKYAAWIEMAFMAFFTPLTLYLALQEMIRGHEMVHDCGCFGDAWILTNWETFFKNLIILVPSIFLFVKRNSFSSAFSCKIDIAIATTVFLTGISISVYAYLHLPQHDFRPYKIGTNIPEAMTVPEGAPQPVYETYLYYKKDGETKEFTMETYPKEPGWEFVDSKSILIEKGYEAPIHDFTIVSDEEGDITEDVLADSNYSILVVAYSLPKASIKNAQKLNALYEYCNKKGFAFRALTSSMDEEIQRFRDKSGAKYPFYATDPITLKTVIRANPGIVLLKDGTIINKWHGNDLPDIKSLKKDYFENTQQ